MKAIKSIGIAANNSNSMQFIEQGDNLLVDARLLHTQLEVSSIFANWIKRRIEEFGFENGKDFFPNLEKSSGGRKAVEYHLTLDMAKELAMLERSESGKAIRRAFIQAEKDLRNKRLYSQVANLTQISKDVKPNNINGRKMYDLRKVQVVLGFSPKSSLDNVRRKYASQLVLFNNRSYVSEEYVRVMMASATLRSQRIEAMAAQPVLPANFGQMSIVTKGGVSL